MKHTVRSFSIGLLAAGLIMLVVFYFFDNPRAEEPNYDTDAMIAKLEQDGYRIVTEEEYITLSVANAKEDNEGLENQEVEESEKSPEEDEDNTSKDNEKENNSEKQEEADEDDEENKEDGEEREPKTVTITIEPGMASSHISSMLLEENLIDDEDAFNSYLRENDYSLRVQMGDHELQTGMSFYEIAEALTN